MKRILLVALASLSLVACDKSADIVNSAANNAVVVSNETAPIVENCGLAANSARDEQALFAAELAYNSAANAYVQLTPVASASNLRAAARPFLLQSYDYLLLARKAHNAANGCSLKRYSDLAQALGNKAKSTLGK